MQWIRRARFGSGLWACLPVLALLSGSLLTGCSTSEYDERLNKSIKDLKLANKFVSLDPTEIELAKIRNEQGVGAKISFRKPTYFANAAMTVDAQDPRNPTQKINPERVKPAQLMNFPGFQFSYEQRAPFALGLAYAYFGAQPTDPAAAERIELAFKKEADKINPPAAAPVWTSVQVDTADGGSAPWRMISQSGPNKFWLEGNPQADHLGGTFIVWMREDKGFQVFLGLRVTSINIDLNELKKQMTAAAGTVRVVSPTKID